MALARKVVLLPLPIPEVRRLVLRLIPAWCHPLL